MGVFRLNALRTIDESPWTRNWDHLAPVPKLSRASLKIQKISIPVPAKDRIRQWNIVPGDRIRIRGDKGGSIREVFGVNKYNNLVYFKASQVRTSFGFSCMLCRLFCIAQISEKNLDPRKDLRNQKYRIQNANYT